MNLVGTLIGIPMEYHVNPRGMTIIGGLMIIMLMIMGRIIQKQFGQIVNQGLMLTMIVQSTIARLAGHVWISEMLTAGMERNPSVKSRGVRMKENKSPLVTINDMMVESTINMQIEESKSILADVIEMIESTLRKEIITGLLVRTRKSSRRRRS
uniref:Uncharacterized protein n=1 Tax=Arundo donax TaxID=35708 RepID=A0A0A9EZ37_ARUDO